MDILKDQMENKCKLWANKALHLTAKSMAVLQGFVPYQSFVVFQSLCPVVLAAGELCD